MKNKLIILSFCATLLYSFMYAQPAAPSGKKWEKVNNLSDEFNGGFDNNKWEKVLWDYPNTPTKMVAQNSGVSGGNLWIKATLDNNSSRWFQSSRVYSKAQIKFPMYTESRMITAHLSAYNTFWLNNGDINNRDEIDIVENNSRPSCGCQPNFPWQMNSQYFQVVNGNTERNKGDFDNRNLSPGNPKRGVRWNEEYHVVGMWWKDANNVQFYLDGEPAGSVRTNRPLTRNLNLIWDLWTDDENFLGGVAVRSHLTNNNINTMKVDYVRTYKLVNDGNGGGGGGGGNGGGNGDSFNIISAKSQKNVSPINGSSANGAKIVNHPVRTGDAREWRFVDVGNGYSEIKNVRSGRCIAVPGGNTANGVKLVQWDCRGYQDQHWKRVARDNGQFSFQNLKTGKCIDLSGGNTGDNVQFQQWDCSSGNRNQRFYILSPGSRAFSNDIPFDDALGEIIFADAEGNLNISNSSKGTFSIRIIDMTGRTIQSHQVKSGGDDIIIELGNNLPSGIYAVKIGNRNAKKFAITRK
ncbi:RICIN domain-containing protein [Aquimarina sp. RZ0]|uniref:RICIN domain-containing protein n=1 Tax=Aquimarina sp. RZ0 TaxID=2607730 RepID=UPI0011F1D45F|nr:RICIN domain-containing protein [Aquimarina sp. RZ0]KAA1248033.1 T9SS type A sorting domain-containing protein [Aquimarina sp. RZ0]